MDPPPPVHGHGADPAELQLRVPVHDTDPERFAEDGKGIHARRVPAGPDRGW
jgi:hypothetical protein